MSQARKRSSSSPTVPGTLKTNLRPGSRPQSPLASPVASPRSSPISSPGPKTDSTVPPDGDFVIDPDSESSPRPRPRKDHCPCGISSGGESWIIPCSTCKQIWHNACAGLKGTFTKPVLASLAKSWQCPWCFICPFSRPSSHVTEKGIKELKEKLLTADTIQKITESVSSVFTEAIQDTFQTQGIQDQLNELSTQIKEFCGSQKSAHPTQVMEFQFEEPASLEIDCKEQPICDTKTDYLDNNLAENIKTLLKDAKDGGLFKNKNGRSTLSYGEKYKYAGSSSEPQSPEIPPAIKELIGKITNDFNLKDCESPNSVLINFFPAKVNPQSPKSTLPKHADDEIEIEPDSKIFTYSMGGPRMVTFSSIHSEETNSHEAISNSLYVMTRKSQAWYKHEILDAESCQERFSITLRRVNANNKRSTLLIGDSNSKEIKFGSGPGTVGERYPGRRVKASKINNIDPSMCVDYANIVIACGTNDLRPTSIKGDTQKYLTDLLATLTNKIEQISLLTNAKIFIVPVPPTRDPKMNTIIRNFNNMVMKSCLHDKFGCWFPGLYDFLDKSGLLHVDMARGGDPIHFGSKGISKFVRVLKEIIYERERTENHSSRVNTQQNGRHKHSGSQRPP